MFVFVIVNLVVLVSSLAGLSIVILSIVNSLEIILINYVVLQKLYGLAVRLNIAMGYLTVFYLRYARVHYTVDDEKLFP